MEHRHLQGDTLSLAAIDDIIERGQRDDWARLSRAASTDTSGQVIERIERVCASRRANAEAADEAPSQSFTAWECFIERVKLQPARVMSR
jgi:hypothetical protein